MEQKVDGTKHVQSAKDLPTEAWDSAGADREPAELIEESVGYEAPLDEVTAWIQEVSEGLAMTLCFIKRGIWSLSILSWYTWYMGNGDTTGRIYYGGQMEPFLWEKVSDSMEILGANETRLNPQRR